MMKDILPFILILLSLLVLALLAVPGLGATYQLPSEMLTKQSHPAVINLQDVSPSSAQAIDRNLAELASWTPMNMADLGHYHSDQNLTSPEGIPLSLFNFSKNTQDLLVSIGKPNPNATTINETASSGFVYL